MSELLGCGVLFLQTEETHRSTTVVMGKGRGVEREQNVGQGFRARADERAVGCVSARGTQTGSRIRQIHSCIQTRGECSDDF